MKTVTFKSDFFFLQVEKKTPDEINSFRREAIKARSVGANKEAGEESDTENFIWPQLVGPRRNRVRRQLCPGIRIRAGAASARGRRITGDGDR